MPDSIPHTSTRGVNGKCSKNTAPRSRPADVPDLRKSDHSKRDFAQSIPTTAISTSGSNPTPSNNAKVSEHRNGSLKNARKRFLAAESDLAKLKKKTNDPTTEQMTTNDVGVEIAQKTNELNERRSELFKLEHPEVAARRVIPKFITAKTRRKWLAEYKASKHVTSIATHNLPNNGAVPSKFQNVRMSSAKSLHAKGDTASTKGLVEGETNDNPITID